MAKVNKKVCTACENEKRIGEFYKSASKLHSDGKLNICKDCTMKHYEELLSAYDGDTNSSWKHLCYNLDIFYDEDLYLKCSVKDNFIGEYMRLLATKDRRNKTSVNNLISGEIKEVTLDEGSISEDLIDRWGAGYSLSEYRKLEKKYKTYLEHYPNKRLQEQEILKQLAELDLMKEQCRVSGDRNGYDKISTQIRRTMEDLNVLPKQSSDDDEQMTLGNIIKMIEYEEPIPMTSLEFDDVNRIEEIMEKYFISPFKKVLGLKNKDIGAKDE